MKLVGQYLPLAVSLLLAVGQLTAQEEPACVENPAFFSAPIRMLSVNA